LREKQVGIQRADYDDGYKSRKWKRSAEIDKIKPNKRIYMGRCHVSLEPVAREVFEREWAKESQIDKGASRDDA